jgi:hypothetical protein
MNKILLFVKSSILLCGLRACKGCAALREKRILLAQAESVNRAIRLHVARTRPKQHPTLTAFTHRRVTIPYSYVINASGQHNLR